MTEKIALTLTLVIELVCNSNEKNVLDNPTNSVSVPNFSLHRMSKQILHTPKIFSVRRMLGKVSDYNVLLLLDFNFISQI